MGKPKYIIIQNNGKEVQKLAVFFDGTFETYAICFGNGGHFGISHERFNQIIDEAREKGYDVFDYRTFD